MRRAKRPQRRLQPISITFPPDLATAAAERAAGLDLTRSQYFRHLIRADLAQAKLDKELQP